VSLTEKVEVVLVEPAEGGNVGSCARALKNMGFTSFNMVDPRYEDRPMARKMAVHAQDVLDSARVFASIEEVTKDAHWVVATSVRSRTHPERKPPIGPDEFIQRLRDLPEGSKAALLFGPERTGLTNDQLGKCQDILTIPTSADFSSMNLAQAVMVIAWEIRKADLEPLVTATRDQTVTAGQIDDLLAHMRRTLDIIEFLDPQNPDLILDDLRKVLARAALDKRELSMLRGIFHRMDVYIAEHGGPPTPNQARGKKKS
jgi:TrmH family RNA methyltransferase